MKENKLISLTALKDAFSKVLSEIVDEGMRLHTMETFDTSIGYVKKQSPASCVFERQRGR